MASLAGASASSTPRDRLIINYCNALQSGKSAKEAKDAVRARMFTLLAKTGGMTQLKIQPILMNNTTALTAKLTELYTIEQTQPGVFKYAPDLSFLVRANHVVVRGTQEERQALLHDLGESEAALRMQTILALDSSTTSAARAPAAHADKEERKESKDAPPPARRPSFDDPLDAASRSGGIVQDDLPGSSRPEPPPVSRTPSLPAPSSSDSYLWQLWSTLPGFSDIRNWASGTKAQ